MSVAQRLAQLERLEHDRQCIDHAERLAERYGLSVEDVLRKLEEMGRRIERYGLDAELRRLARENGVSDDVMRAEYDRVVADYESP